MEQHPPGWRPHDGGASIGWMGTQGGAIVRDEVFAEQLRLTYEADESRSFHAITCTVTGWLMHHRFFDDAGDAHAAFDAMKPAMEALGARLREGGPRSPQEAREGGPLLADFIARFP